MAPDSPEEVYDYTLQQNVMVPGTTAFGLKVDVTRSVAQTATAANVLVGLVTQTATTSAATIITIPQGRTWIGTIALSCDVANVGAGTAVGQALGTVATAGTNVTPAVGTVFQVEARCGANVAGGTVGDSGNNANSIPMTVIAPAGNAVTLTLASTQVGTNSTVTVTASGVLL